MLHAEILARLKHPRPERHNGNRFEARTTPVHFMMTANHRAPSIEICRIASDMIPFPLPSSSTSGRNSFIEGRVGAEEIIGSEPNESVPHVMISLALEDDQNLNIDDWERWLATIPALARYVRVQGVFKSHSTLLLLSLPVMVWDMLPDHRACNFIAFIRSNNLVAQKKEQEQGQGQGQEQLNTVASDASGAEFGSDQDSIYSGTTVTMDQLDLAETTNWPGTVSIYENKGNPRLGRPGIQADAVPATRPPSESNMPGWLSLAPHISARGNPDPVASTPRKLSNVALARRPGQTQALQSAPQISNRPSSRPMLPEHAEKRLEEYFINNNTKPTVAVKEFLASSLGIQTADIDVSCPPICAEMQLLTTLFRAGSASAANCRRFPTNYRVCEWATRTTTLLQKTMPG